MFANEEDLTLLKNSTHKKKKKVILHYVKGADWQNNGENTEKDLRINLTRNQNINKKVIEKH